jgi:uncharacterized membrane protein YcaP (DUF421 family)
MDLTLLLFRTLLMYFFVLVMLRLMGKREIGKLSVFDLVISIMIAEIAVIAIDSERPLLHSVAPIALLVLTQMGLAYLSLKSRRLRQLFDGKPSVLISDGKLNWREMRKQRYTLDDLAVQLRENQVLSVDDVQLAVLEPTGKLSVIPKDSQSAGSSSPSRGGADGPPKSSPQASSRRAGENGGKKEKADNRPKIRYELLPVPLIMDGEVQDENLQRIGKTRFWLKRELKRHGVNRFGDVFYCSVDHRGKLFVDRKD